MLTASPELRAKLRGLTKEFSRHEMGQWEKILAPLDRSMSILEVGCGRGEKTDFLRAQGFNNILSVEKNEFQVRECCKRGLNVVTLDEFAQNHSADKFDFIVLSHIIEHFDFEGLVDFIDGYLNHLKPGGLLLIATPMLHPHFWLDLDHRKPYYPQGIKNFYSGAGEQVGFTSKYRLKLKDIRFRRSPFRIKNDRNLLLKKNDLPMLVFNLISAALFKCSFGLLGYKTAWIGLYELKI
ncbi:bifunctional 2-polyprenyl-6-hydroxyphenol methylase/3-demethylubiquinol 3-O-methyltransferase UbiG [Desulfovibrio sp. JC010]|uniref:class I SAM-dependent methyltransferase n=1 Tax=Desulfovibrio sp. JC010 TaxID=2593641 RepID=UPI0013D2E16F|nr:class I SAM-dependent methyltransferase [Desulfovibrio sp. JC010]NDV27285.1 class I SAM-dependent methyltransferase [Desulfovibrio sp. JC010]